MTSPLPSSAWEKVEAQVSELRTQMANLNNMLTHYMQMHDLVHQQLQRQIDDNDRQLNDRRDGIESRVTRMEGVVKQLAELQAEKRDRENRTQVGVIVGIIMLVANLIVSFIR